MLAFNDADAATSPFVTPSWRYKVIEFLVNQGNRRAPKHRKVDPVLQKFADGLSRTGEFASEASNVARKIFLADDEYRAEIEARILAGEDVVSIADHTRLPESVIREYEFLFFDVRRFSNATDWLRGMTTGFKNLTGFGVNDVRPFWCHIGLGGGPIVVDGLITAFKSSRLISQAFSLAVYLRQNSSVGIELQSFVASSIIPVTGNGILWREDFGLELLAIRKVLTSKSRAEAFRALQARIVDCGRLIVSGKPLPPPPNWESNRLKESPVISMEQAFANVNMLRDALGLGSPSKPSMSQTEMGKSENRGARILVGMEQ